MKAQLLLRIDLSDLQVGAMFMLLSKHFDGVTRAHFLSDLDAKSHALLMTDDGGRLVGFSTLDFKLMDFAGQTESVVFSGDTIMDPESWNSTILSRAWIEAVYQIHARQGQGPLWWLLITSGFRTYRLLPVFWREFFPSCKGETPASVHERMLFYAHERFGSQFTPATGVVRLPHPQRLRAHLRGIPAERVNNRHIAFFSQRNPGHAEGDELVCLTRLEEDNLSPGGRRIVDAMRRHPVLCRDSKSAMEATTLTV